MKYKCGGCWELRIPCDYTFEWKDTVDYSHEDYELLPQKHKDHLIANKHDGFLKINDPNWEHLRKKYPIKEEEKEKDGD